MAAETDPNKRALLAAMAQEGTQAVAKFNTAQVNPITAPSDAGPTIATPGATVGPQGPAPVAAPAPAINAAGTRKDGVAAALARSQQIDAPLAFQKELTGQIGTVYDQAGATRARNAGAYGALSGAYNRATNDYLTQLQAAQPLMDKRLELAVRQIQAERQNRAEENAYRRDALRLDKDKLAFERQQFEAQQVEDGIAEPLTLNQAASKLKMPRDKAALVLSTPGYDTGRQLILQAAEDGYSAAELRGLLDSYVTGGSIPDASGIPQAFDKSMADLLYETYAPSFATKGEQSEAAQDARSRTAARAAVNSGQAFDVLAQRAVPRMQMYEDGSGVTGTRSARGQRNQSRKTNALRSRGASGV